MGIEEKNQVRNSGRDACHDLTGFELGPSYQSGHILERQFQFFFVMGSFE